MPVITNLAAIRPAIVATDTRRVDWVGIGDSNQGPLGWDHGLQYALNLQCGLYAVGIFFCTENNGLGSGIGFKSQYNSSGAPVKVPSATATGTVATTSGSATLTGTSTAFLSELVVGQSIRVGSGTYFRVVSVASDVSATLELKASASVSGQTLTTYPKPPSGLFQFADWGASSEGADGSSSLFPLNYSYVASGSTSNAADGLILSGDSPLDTSAALQFDFRWGSFDSGSGSARPGVRLGASPFTVVQMAGSGAISTNTGSFALQRTTVDITASAARLGVALEARFQVPGQATITGPWYGLHCRASNPAKTTGASYHTIEYRGGKSARTMALDFINASNATLTEIFSESRRLQTGDKIVVVCINGGLNDRNETLPSVGPAPVADGDSAEAFADNLQAIINRIKAIWTLNGWAESELYFLLMPSHPVSNPDDAELISYRTAAAGVANANARTAAVDLAQLVTSGEMLANGWYASSGSDTAHLTQAGYEALGMRVLMELGTGISSGKVKAILAGGSI